MKLHAHKHTMVIYIQYKFHEIPSICYLAMTEDEKTSVKGHNSTTNVQKNDVQQSQPQSCQYQCIYTIWLNSINSFSRYCGSKFKIVSPKSHW